MGVTEILYATVGILILIFILLLIVIWYMWYIYSDMQNNYDSLMDAIDQQDAVLVDLAEAQEIDARIVLTKRVRERLSKMKK